MNCCIVLQREPNNKNVARLSPQLNSILCQNLGSTDLPCEKIELLGSTDLYQKIQFLGSNSHVIKLSFWVQLYRPIEKLHFCVTLTYPIRNLITGFYVYFQWDNCISGFNCTPPSEKWIFRLKGPSLREIVLTTLFPLDFTFYCNSHYNTVIYG